MWFAYVDNSMAWYDLDVAEVKKMISINKKNQKTPALEDLKTFSGAEGTETVDLIQENNLNRFEKKKQKFKPRNNGNNNSQNNNRPQNAVKEEGKKEESNGQAPKKFNKQKKRYPPKKKD